MSMSEREKEGNDFLSFHLTMCNFFWKFKNSLPANLQSLSQA